MQKIKKGDMVQILLGKDRGKSGQIERVLKKKSQVYVSNLNVYRRHVRGREGIEGRIVNLSKPMEISNVSLICSQCKKITRVGFKFVQDGKIRVCKKCGKEI